MSAPRYNWTHYCRDPFGIFCGAVLSAMSSDRSLLPGIMALRKFNLLTFDKLSSRNTKIYKQIVATLASAGFALAETHVANLMAACAQIKDLHNGKIPDNAEDLMALWGVGPKVMALVMQD